MCDRASLQKLRGPAKGGQNSLDSRTVKAHTSPCCVSVLVSSIGGSTCMPSSGRWLWRRVKAGRCTHKWCVCNKMRVRYALNGNIDLTNTLL